MHNRYWRSQLHVQVGTLSTAGVFVWNQGGKTSSWSRYVKVDSHEVALHPRKQASKTSHAAGKWAHGGQMGSNCCSISNPSSHKGMQCSSEER